MSEDVEPEVERARARVGSCIRGKWTLERLIGVGGMAAVYAGTHRNGLKGAVKVLHSELGRNRDAKERFLREGYAANQVGHPGAVRVLDDDVAEDGSVFLVMELLEGQTVEARAAARPGARLPADEVLAIADMTLDVLASAHPKGIVHRDLKPENLFLTMAGDLRILDFGIARVREIQGSRRTTQTGAAMGTPAFMAPEQASGQWDLVDARTDLWAVGATMFSLLTGRIVHQAPTLQLLMLAAMTKPAPPLAGVQPGVPAAVAAIVDRALAFDLGRRWPNAREMQRAVRAARGAAPASIVPALSMPAGHLLVGSEATLMVANPTTSPVSTGAAAARRGSGAGKLIAVGGGLAAIAVGSALWLGLRGGGGAVPAASASTPPVTASAELPAPPMPPPATTPAAPPPPAVEPAAAPQETSSAAPPPSAGRPPGRPAVPAAPVARPKATSAPKHPGIY